MKKLILLSSICITTLFFAFKSRVISSIYGNIQPPEGAKIVWAINGNDSVSVVPLAGKFSIAVTEGTWKLRVQAVPPYQDAIIDKIDVVEGRSANAGMITLTK